MPHEGLFEYTPVAVITVVENITIYICAKSDFGNKFLLLSILTIYPETGIYLNSECLFWICIWRIVYVHMYISRIACVTCINRVLLLLHAYIAYFLCYMHTCTCMHRVFTCIYRVFLVFTCIHRVLLIFTLYIYFNCYYIIYIDSIDLYFHFR